MHYRNGREAKNGDRVVQLSSFGDAKITAVGVLVDAVAGSDYCNGMIAPTVPAGPTGACMVDCIHADDLAELIKAAGLDKRPAGK